MSAGRRESEDGPGVGDIVIIPYPRVREQLNCPAEAGLLMEDRRNIVRLFFPTSDQSFWLDREKVEAVPLGRLNTHPLVDRVHRIANIVDVVLLELVSWNEDEVAVHVFSPAMSLDDLLAIRALIGGKLRDFQVEAGSVRRVKLLVRFVL